MSDPPGDTDLHVFAVGQKALADLVPAKIDGCTVQTVRCADGAALFQQISESVPDVVLMAAKHALGQDCLLERLLGEFHDLPVIVLGEDLPVEAVVECMKKRAEDFVLLSQAAEKLPEKLLKARQKHQLLMQVNQLREVYKRGDGKLADMVGVSPAMQHIYTTIKNISNTDATVLVSGESGTGKELVANAIHSLSPRSEGAFVTVNCAAIPKDLLESELFGHEKGAFTSADRLRIGSCERADKGTLFLDEICEMDTGLQSKLLRFLQNHTFTRVGGTEDIKVDTRVIAATNRDPDQAVQQQNLRHDLYYRLNVVPIFIPPLRERIEDIPVLAEHFLKLMSEKYYKYFYDFSPEAIKLLLTYDWPGNVRELRNTIERIVVLATSDRVDLDIFPARIRQATAGKKVPPLAIEKALECLKSALQAPVSPPDSDEVLPFAEVEKRAILNAVQKCDGDISKAARKLGLSRATLYRKLAKYGVK